MATVRITDDATNDALKKRAAELAADDPTMSATKLANLFIRQGLGLEPRPGDNPADRSGPGIASPQVSDVSKADIDAARSKPRRRPPTPAVAPKDCTHPPGRVISGTCMICGGKA